MQIDFIISSIKGGGAERVMVLLANYFASKGHQIRIITFSTTIAYTIDRKVEVSILDKSNIKNHKLKWLYNLFLFYKKKKNRPSILISFSTLTNMISIIIAKLYHIKIIVSEHNNHLRVPNPKFLTNFTRNTLYPLADTVTVLTKYDVEFYEKKGSKVTVMPNPCTFTPIEKSLKNREKTILAVGRLNRYNHKGFDNLIDIVKEAFEGNDEWVLKILGDGDRGLSFLKEKVSQYGLENKVIFEGFCSNVAEYMEKSEIFILSSRYEGLPMVLLEAMSQGMSCISYDCITGPSDIITHGYNGILVKDQDKDLMVKELKELMNDFELRETLSKNAIKSLNSFEIENIYKKWMVLINEVTN